MPCCYLCVHRAEQLYQKVMSLWHQLHVNMKSVVSWHYLLKDIKTISEWDLDVVRPCDKLRLSVATSSFSLVFYLVSPLS